jgi:hypothetical protein
MGSRQSRNLSADACGSCLDGKGDHGVKSRVAHVRGGSGT